MKARHRHELKTNELAEWIASFPQWAGRNRTTLIYVSALIIVVAGLYIWKIYTKNVLQTQKQLQLTSLIARLPQSKIQIITAQAKGVDISYMLIQTADDLQAVARTAKNNTLAALALIKRAEALRTELHYRPETPSRQDITDQLNRAKTAYTEALEKATSNPPLTATAKFGLGLCEEEFGNFEEARKIYHEVATNPDLEGTVAAVQAKQRLETMDDYRQKPLFKEDRGRTTEKSDF